MTSRKTTSRKTTTSSGRAKTKATSTAKSTGTSTPKTATTAKAAPVAKPDMTATVTTPETDGMAAAQPTEAAGPVRPTLKKKELFERVKARANGVKGHDVRVVLDAVLEELGQLLVDGDSLNAQPLGTLKVQKHRPISGADVVVCKLRRKKPEGPGKDPLAEAAE